MAGVVFVTLSLAEKRAFYLARIAELGTALAALEDDPGATRRPVLIEEIARERRLMAMLERPLRKAAK